MSHELDKTPSLEDLHNPSLLHPERPTIDHHAKGLSQTKLQTNNSGHTRLNHFWTLYGNRTTNAFSLETHNDPDDRPQQIYKTNLRGTSWQAGMK